MTGATFADWCSLLAFDVEQPRLLEYDFDRRTCHLPNISVPWYVCWFLSRFQRKTVFVGRPLPRLHHVHKCADTFRNKFLWYTHFLKRGGDPKPIIPRPRGRQVRKFCLPVDPEIKYIADALHHCVVHCCRSALHCYARGPRASNFLPIDKLAGEWLAKSEFSVQASHKDGVFVLVP